MKTKKHNYLFNLRKNCFLKYLIFLLINHSISLLLLSCQNLAPASKLVLSISNQERELVQKRASNQELKNKARSIIIKSLMANSWRIDLAADNLGIHRKKVREIVGSKFIKGKKEQFEENYVFNALEASNWNISLASKNFNISPSKIYRMFSRYQINENRTQAIEDENRKTEKLIEIKIKDIANQKKAALEKKHYKETVEIIKAIKLFLNQSNCLELVAKYLKLPIGTLKDRIHRYNISVNNMKFNQTRVIPVLIETMGNLREASTILGIDRQVLSNKFSSQVKKIKELATSIQDVKNIGSVLNGLEASNKVMTRTAKHIGVNISTLNFWMAKYEILKLSPLDKTTYSINRRFFIMDDMIKSISEKSKEIDEKEANSIHLFLNATKLKLFYIKNNIIDKFKKEIENEDIIERMIYYEDFVNSSYNELDIEDKNQKELLSILKKITKKMNTFMPQTLYLTSKLELYTVKHKRKKQLQLKAEPKSKTVKNANTKNITSASTAEIISADTSTITSVDKSTITSVDKSTITSTNTKKIDKPKTEAEIIYATSVNGKKQKADFLEKEEIIKAIKLFMNQKECLLNVAMYLNLSRKMLKIKMNTYHIYLDQIRYNENRVLPVLIETLADLDLTSEILEVDKYELKRRFSRQIDKIKKIVKDIRLTEKIGAFLAASKKSDKDMRKTAEILGLRFTDLNLWIKRREILKLTPENKIKYTLNSEFLIMDDLIIKMHKRAMSVDNKEADTINSFLNTSKFMLFRILKKINDLKIELRFRKIPEDISDRLKYYEKYINKLFSTINLRNQKHFNLLLVFAEVTTEMNNLIPQTLYLFNKLELYTINHTPTNISKNYRTPLQQSA